MKRYFESHIDYSEVEYITTKEKQITRANDTITELGLLNGKKLNSELITQAIRPEEFFNRLQYRMKNLHGFSDAVDNLHMLYERRDYYGVYLYLVFLFGFVHWRTPRELSILPASSEYLKQYLSEFMKVLDQYTVSSQEDTVPQLEDDSL